MSPSRFFQRLQSSERLLGWLATALFVGIFIIDYLTTTPLIHEENYVYLPYLGASSPNGLAGQLLKIFDVCHVDACVDRFRPGGHLLELIDAHAIQAFGGLLGFHSPLHLVLVLGLIPLLAAGFKYLAPSLPTASRWALGAYFSTASQVLVLSSFYFRPGKIFAACATAFIFWFWMRYRGRELRSAAWISLAGLLSLLLLFDEQIVITVGVFAGASVLDLIRRRGGPVPVIAFVLATLIYLATVKWVAPITYEWFSSSSALPSYSSLSDFFVLDREHSIQAYKALVIQFATLFGPSMGWIGLSTASILAAFSALVYWRPRQPQPREPDKNLGWTALYLIVATFVMIYVLSLRHPPILWAELKHGGYYYVVSALILYLSMMFIFASRGVFKSAGKRTALLLILMTSAVIHAATIGPTRAMIQGSAFLGNAIQNRDIRAAISGDTDAFSRLPESARNFVRYYIDRIKPSSR